jgi:transcriptional regulator with PAS, ATPase and Fis domain
LDELPNELQIPTLTNLTQESLPLSAFSEEMERAKIEEVLKRTDGNKASAARVLGISRGSLYYKMKQYNLQ